MYAVVVRETGQTEAIEGSEAHLAAKVVPRVREAPGPCRRSGCRMGPAEP